MRNGGNVMGRLVPGGREHHTWCSLWAVWDNEPGSPALRDLEASCTCGELVVEDVIAWWGGSTRKGAFAATG